MIEKGALSGSKEEWALGMLTSSLQMIRDQSSEDPYYKAAVYTMNDLIEQGVVVFKDERVSVTDFNKFYEINNAMREEIVGLYQNEEMTEGMAEAWLRKRCRPTERTKKLIDYLQREEEE